MEKHDKCGGKVKVIVEASNRSIEDPEVIDKLLQHPGLDKASQTRNRSPPDALFDHKTNLS